MFYSILMWCLDHLVFYDAIRTSERCSRASRNDFLAVCLDKMISFVAFRPLHEASLTLRFLCCPGVVSLLGPSWCCLAPKSKNGVSPRRDTLFLSKKCMALRRGTFCCLQGLLSEVAQRRRDDPKKVSRRFWDSLKRYPGSFRIIKYEVKYTSRQDGPTMHSYTCVQKC